MLKFFKEYMPYYKEYKKEIFFAIIGMILVSFATAATAYLVKPVLDKIFIEKNEKMLYILPIAIIVLYFLKGLGYILQQYFVSYIGEDIVRKIRDKFLGHILKSDINFFKTTHSGELVSRIINDINRIQRAVSSDIAALMRDILMSIFLLGVVLYQNYKLAIFALIILPLIVYPINLIAQKLKKLSKKSQEKTANLNATLSEIFKNVETIKAYNAEDFEHKKFSKLNLEFLKVNLKSTKLNALVVPLMEFVSAVVAAIVIIVGGKLVIDGSMSVGEFFSFMTALFMMSDPLRKISVTYSKLQDAIAANERLKEIFNIKPAIKDGKEKLKNIETIEFKNVSLKYNNKYALKNINYFAKKPKIVGLVGDSGGGKSSFISLIERFYDTSNGEILINNKNIKNYSIKDLREKISYIPQTIHIFNDTIAANIAYGREIDEEKVINALKQANLWEFVKNLPNGIYEILQENGSNLSGGQRQRIAIARALYKNPDILILDEATSALDRKSEEKVMESILNLKDKLIFIVAHRLSTIENADEILVFKEGKIVCKGNKEELLKNCEEFKKLYNN
ncbi:ABC transporter ATP-binding protein [Caminibacter mediatlanticus]|uniref:Multidrug resistance protein msba n=1 Tax=Caminibacter mediatlanticus TB-2 TaxID=391592 RepID=A0AAI9AH40_9BACT|nr:ABC transporter ATP-binding protein [Caminibacter mediatlanticus]EDM23558.1 multidrug resistance protein msba [Caminibacter mediatlanticus TB-2]